MNFNTKVIHGGQHHESATGSVNVPVFLTSTFADEKGLESAASIYINLLGINVKYISANPVCLMQIMITMLCETICIKRVLG